MIFSIVVVQLSHQWKSIRLLFIRKLLKVFHVACITIRHRLCV
ncbi:MAG: hypothetical protein OJF50_005842 [Nitrospira sp.]|nr:hypothetical protein [Nitrospira sp.]